MAKKNALEEAKNLYNRIRGGISAGSQNFKGNVQAIANPATRADFFRGFNPTNPVQPIQIGSMTLGPTYGQQQLVQGTMRGLYDYGKGQVVQPILNAPRQIIQGIQQTAQPGLGASGLPNRVVGPIKVGLGALGAVGGAFSATPIGATFNTIQGGLAGGIRSFRTGQPLGRSVYQGITEPTGIMSQGFGVKNPIVAGLGDLAFGLGVGGVTAKLTGHLPKQPVKEQISSVARKRYVSKLKGLYPEEMPQRNIQFDKVGNNLIRRESQAGFIKPSEFLPKKGGQKVSGVQEPGKMRAEYPDSTNNPLYQAMRRAQDALTAKIEPLRSKYKTEAEIPAPLKKELTILQTDWQTKAKTWKDVYVNKMDVGAGLTQEQARAKFQASRGLASKTSPLTTEAQKVGDVSYRSPHQILGDTKQAGDLNIEEVIKKAKEYNGYLTKYDLADLNKLKKIQGNPEMEVKIYRSSPVNELNNGDWITTSKTYAQDIKKQNGGKVYEYTVKASDLKYPNDITELPSLARFSAFKYEPTIPIQSTGKTPLSLEAQKYGSADTVPITNNTIYRAGELRNGSKSLKGDWFSTTEDYAGAYSKRLVKTKSGFNNEITQEVKSYGLKPDAKILSYKDLPANMKPYPSGTLQFDDFKNQAELQNKAFDFAKKKGYDAVGWGNRELNIINRDAIKEISQPSRISGQPIQESQSLSGQQNFPQPIKQSVTSPNYITNQFTGKTPLSLEAKKYKSAEEFVRAQGTPVYHGSKNEIKVFGDVPDSGTRFWGRGTYFTDNASRAKEFGKINEAIVNLKNPYRQGEEFNNTLKLEIRKLYGKKEASIAERIIQRKEPLKATEINSDLITKLYQKAGYDGVISTGGVFGAGKGDILVFNPSQIKTKSQLTDIYNQAKGGGVGRVTTQIPKDQSLGLQEIGSNLPPTVSPKAGKVRITDKPLDLSKSRPSKPIIPENPIRAEITGVKKPGLITKIREVVQDNWIRVKELQRQEGVKVTESANPYLKEELYHGRVGARIERVKEQITNVDKDILTTSKKINLPDSKLKDDINKYLIAKHAPERNARLGDGSAGMTNKEAQDILSGITSSGHGKEVQRIATELKKMSDETLDVLLRERVIGKDLYNQLKTAYKNHIPLQRVMGGEDIVDVLVNKGFSVQGTGLKRARGSERQVADLMTNITSNLEQAIVRSEKNRVNLATLEFARNNKQLGIFEEIKPRAIGKTFDDKPILQEVKDPLVLKVMEDGKPTYLKIKDQKLATVFQGIGNERLPSVFKFVEAFTRFYSGLHTRFNPEFAASNIIRDTQEMAVFMASQPNIGFKGVGKTVLKDPASAKTIIDSMMGKSTPETKLYEQLKLDGGTTGGMAISTRQQVELDIADIVKTNRSNPRLATQKLLKSFDNWNTVFEDATRLSVYKQGLESGMSREAAASLAKNSTINFNKKGTGGPIINSLYMFSNASIQGSAKMLRAMKNPKVAAIVTTAVGTSVFAVNNWNDQVDPDWRDKVTEWDRNSNMVVMLPSSEGAKYITIPISWGLKPIKVAADTAFDLSSGHQKNIGDAAVNIAESAFDAYNPAGGENLISAITPTFLDTPSELARNESWSGGIIKPDWMSGLRGSEQMFKDTDKTLSGRVAIGTTKALSTAGIEVSPNDLLYAYKAYIGGVGKLATRVINTSGALIKGEKPEAKDVPFSNRFYKVRSEEETSRSVTKSKEVDFMRGVKRFETGGVEQKDFIRDYVIQLPTDEDRQSFLYKIGQSGIPTKGISSTIKNLAIQFYLSGDKEQAKELGTKYTFNVTQKEVESEKKRLVGEVADLFVEGKEDEAKKMSDTYSLTVRTIDAQKAAKKLAKKKYKSGDIEGAKALTVKYKFILTNKDVE